MSPKSEATKEAKKQVSLKLTPGKLKQLESAMGEIEEHVGKLAGVWSSATSKQQQAVLERSPVLSRFLALAERVL